jgi:hypothetical protein
MLVEVTHGPLQGVKGRLVREAGHSRLILSISLIQRAVAVEIDALSVAPVEPIGMSLKTARLTHEMCVDAT